MKKPRIEASSFSTCIGLTNADLAELKSLVYKGFEKLNDKLDTMNTKLGNLTKDHDWLKEKVKSMLGVMYNTNDVVEGIKSIFEIRYRRPEALFTPTRKSTAAQTMESFMRTLVLIPVPLCLQVTKLPWIFVVALIMK